ncbi:MAG: hypothetical protein HQL88_05960, partial [Magnetococcales bacterium]|nr:hypothetical protein [Magnetococcales bacterium]
MLLLALCLLSGEALAFSTLLKVEKEEQGGERGAREILSFSVPPNAIRPRMELRDPKVLRLIVPGLLALPHAARDLEQSHLVESFRVEG